MKACGSTQRIKIKFNRIIHVFMLYANPNPKMKRSHKLHSIIFHFNDTFSLQCGNSSSCVFLLRSTNYRGLLWNSLDTNNTMYFLFHSANLDLYPEIKAKPPSRKTVLNKRKKTRRKKKVHSLKKTMRKQICVISFITFKQRLLCV